MLTHGKVLLLLLLSADACDEDQWKRSYEHLFVCPFHFIFYYQIVVIVEIHQLSFFSTSVNSAIYKRLCLNQTCSS